MRYLVQAFLALTTSVLLVSEAQGDLVSRLGGQAVYDTDLDITWLADANAGAGSAFDDGPSTTDGGMTLANANAFVASLAVGGFTDWRLPTTLEPDPSCTLDIAGTMPSPGSGTFNCTGSELGHLFYTELGGVACSSILTSGDPDLALFTNIQTNFYWSDTDFAANLAATWAFNFACGNQSALGKLDFVPKVWAVRDGDVAEPIIDPIVGHFNNVAANLGEPAVSENTSVQPLASFSQTAASGLATSQLDVGVTDSGDSALIEITNLIDIDLGGSESSFSFALQFDLLEEAAYEISGTFTGSFTGTPESDVQFVSGPQFNALSPFTVLFFESDNESGGASSINFTMNGVNEGNIGGNGPGTGSLTGELIPGRYQLTGLTSIFSRGGGFSATGRSDLSLRLTPTGSTPTTLLEQLGTAVVGVGPGMSLADKVVLAQTYFAASDVEATCAVLTDFINQVSAQRGKKLTPALADQLTADAQSIMAAIGCN